MEIKNHFEIPLPPAEAWKVLMDVPRIASCLPGAELTEVQPNDTYKGKVAVKLGPVALSFNIVANIEQRDDNAHSAQIKAQGNDQKGRGSASSTVNVQLSQVSERSRVDLVTQVALTGLIAQYGRGTGVIDAVAKELIGQFANNLRAMLEQGNALPAGATQGSASGGSQQAYTAPDVKPIKGFSLLLRILWQSIRGLFGTRSR